MYVWFSHRYWQMSARRAAYPAGSNLFQVSLCSNTEKQGPATNRFIQQPKACACPCAKILSYKQILVDPSMQNDRICKLYFLRKKNGRHSLMDYGFRLTRIIDGRKFNGSLKYILGAAEGHAPWIAWDNVQRKHAWVWGILHKCA